eukprot:29602-Pelagococcus_subviridis.AAC.2
MSSEPEPEARSNSPVASRSSRFLPRRRRLLYGWSAAKPRTNAAPSRVFASRERVPRSPSRSDSEPPRSRRPRRWLEGRRTRTRTLLVHPPLLFLCHLLSRRGSPPAPFGRAFLSRPTTRLIRSSTARKTFALRASTLRRRRDRRASRRRRRRRRRSPRPSRSSHGPQPLGPPPRRRVGPWAS